MKLNLNQQFVNLVGEPLPDKMDEVLANVMAMSSTHDPQKMMAWATSLLSDGEIEINKDDAEFLKRFIVSIPLLNNLTKDQLLDRIDKALEPQTKV